MSEATIGTKVRVLQPRGIKRLFASREQRKYAGKIGTVLYVEQGTYSKEQVYTVSFGYDASEALVFLGREVEKL